MFLILKVQRSFWNENKYNCILFTQATHFIIFFYF